jgi:protein-tyrosine-phosphatase
VSDRFSLLFLCAGNRFRSPLAAAFLRRLTIGLPVTVASAGMLEVGAAPALAEALNLGAWGGVDLSGHRARRLAAEHVRGVDLVVGFEQIHVRQAVIDVGADRTRAFSVGELVGLLGELDPPAPGRSSPEIARERVRLADRLRGGGLSPDDEIPDPFGGSKKDYRDAAVRVQRLVLALGADLFGVTANGLVLLD